MDFSSRYSHPVFGLLVFAACERDFLLCSISELANNAIFEVSASVNLFVIAVRASRDATSSAASESVEILEIGFAGMLCR